MPGLLTLIGSGEVSAGMVRVHRRLLALPGASARLAFLDTPAGFELGAEAIAARFAEYFQQRFDLPLAVTVHHRADDPPPAIASALQALAASSYILAGPGSPSYAARQWRESQVFRAVGDRWRAGAQLVFASSAAIAISAHTLPVYEIYKVGQELHWVDGVDLLGPFGLNLAIVSHWDNAEGGTHDTRACFMGMERFERLRALLPAEAVVLGIDEHTACTIDLQAGTAEVHGKGGVSILNGNRHLRHEHGQAFPLTDLHPQGGADPAIAPGLAAEPAALARAADHLARGETAEALRAASQAIAPEAAALLHQAASALDAQPPCDEHEARLLDLLVEVRLGLRSAEQWPLADQVRDRLSELGYELRDTPQGTTWEKRASSGTT